MNDVDGPIVASKVYEGLLANDDQFVDPSAIPYALADAVQQLRDSRVHPARWATYVHFGI